MPSAHRTIMTTTITEGALYRLLAWLSPSFPVGAYTYSHGIEAAVEAGAVHDRASLERWIAAILRHGAGRVDADLFRDAWRALSFPSPRLRGEAGGGLSEDAPRGDGVLQPRAPSLPSPASGGGEALAAIATRADIHRGTAETALESRAQGDAFLGTIRAAWPEAAPELPADRPIAYAVAVAATAARAGIALEPALTAYLHAIAANLVSAGMRLVPLGQTDGQRALAALEAVVAECVAASLVRTAEDFGSCALAADLFSMQHETQYTRLFRS
jgi:urease accessory protein